MLNMLLIALTVTIGLILAGCGVFAMFACIAACKFILAAICLFGAVLSIALMFYISFEVID